MRYVYPVYGGKWEVRWEGDHCGYFEHEWQAAEHASEMSGIPVDDLEKTPLSLQVLQKRIQAAMPFLTCNLLFFNSWQLLLIWTFDSETFDTFSLQAKSISTLKG